MCVKGNAQETKTDRPRVRLSEHIEWPNMVCCTESIGVNQPPRRVEETRSLDPATLSSLTPARLTNDDIATIDGRRATKSVV